MSMHNVTEQATDKLFSGMDNNINMANASSDSINGLLQNNNISGQAIRLATNNFLKNQQNLTRNNHINV